MRYNGGSLGGEIGAFIRMMFFLLPAIGIAYFFGIGWWALIPAAAFWVLVTLAFVLVKEHYGDT
jgi:hypothetical protein